jgi:hypothetical protein
MQERAVSRESVFFSPFDRSFDMHVCAYVCTHTQTQTQTHARTHTTRTHAHTHTLPHTHTHGALSAGPPPPPPLWLSGSLSVSRDAAISLDIVMDFFSFFF